MEKISLRNALHLMFLEYDLKPRLAEDRSAIFVANREKSEPRLPEPENMDGLGRQQRISLGRLRIERARSANR